MKLTRVEWWDPETNRKMRDDATCEPLFIYKQKPASMLAVKSDGFCIGNVLFVRFVHFASLIRALLQERPLRRGLQTQHDCADASESSYVVFFSSLTDRPLLNFMFAYALQCTNGVDYGWKTTTEMMVFWFVVFLCPVCKASCPVPTCLSFSLQNCITAFCGNGWMKEKTLQIALV